MLSHHTCQKVSLLLFILLLFSRISAQVAHQNYTMSLDYAEKGAYQQALLTINKALSADSSNYEYFLHRAEIHYALGNYDKTIQDCYTTLRQKPKDPKVYLLRGKVCTVTESFGGAIIFFGKAIQFAQDEQIRFDAYLNRGKALMALNRNDEALRDLGEASQIDGSSVEMLLTLSNVYLNLDRNKEAMQTIQKLITSNPDYAPAYQLYGEIAHKNQDFPQAISAYKKYIELNPGNSAAHNLLAGLYLETKHLDEAMVSVNTALTLDPLEPESYRIKGMIYLAQGEKEKACNTFFRSMQLGYFEKYNYDLLNVYLKECEE